MHYYTKYTDEAAALKDALDWLTPKQLKAATGLAQTKNLEVFELGLSFAGLQGYPVKVLYKHLRKPAAY